MTWKLSLLLTGVILSTLSCTPKNKTSVSLEQKETKDSIALWIESSKKPEFSKQQKVELLNKAFDIIKERPNTRAKTKYLSDISLRINSRTDSAFFRQVNKELMKSSIHIEDNKSHGEAHWDLGTFFRRIQPDSAIYHYREAYNLFLKADLNTTSRDYPGRILFSLADIKDNNKDYIGAEKDIVRAIQFYADNDMDEELFDAYTRLAIAQTGMQKFDKSLQYHRKAKEFIRFSRENKRYRQNTTNTNNMASTNLRNGDYPQAISFYSQLLQTDSLFQKRTKLYSKAKSGLAYAKFKNGITDFSFLIQEFENSNKILDSLGITYDKARNYEYKAEVLHKAGKTGLAIENALLGRKIAGETSNNDRLLSSLKLLTILDKKNSAQYADAYFSLSEELQLQERAIQDKFARIELETDEVIEENESLAKEKETLIGITIGLLLLGLGVFVIINQGSNNQKLRFQQEQQESNQEIYNLMLSQQGKFQEGKQLEQKRISEEIHDGILGQMLGIRLILSGLNERSDESAIAQRAELIEKLQELEEEVRTISHELNSAAYKKINNYIIAIQDLIDTVSSSSKIAISFNPTDSFDWDDLEGDIKINTYRIVQECLQNCVKHAKCKNITVNLNVEHNKILLKVVDDGVGFNVKKGKKGIGLKNIISRVEKINGDLKIKSALGKGTEMIISVSLDNYDSKFKEKNSYKPKKALEV
ncbi:MULTISPECIES: tetratricopeptide repeat-containing sensor histidine kinase [unclassified Croceitalea]|uniref:tetratricopeptide repeat-containing sensor histidine kinase n=1 Tax=unclassified Croceitalea TaxID=2632280 RepID=UPI0030DD7976